MSAPYRPVSGVMAATGETRISAQALGPSVDAAVTRAVPTEMPETSPSPSTVAKAWSLVQVSSASGIGAPSAVTATAVRRTVSPGSRMARDGVISTRATGGSVGPVMPSHPASSARATSRKHPMGRCDAVT